MKKYKLLKRYPGLVDDIHVGDIVVKRDILSSYSKAGLPHIYAGPSDHIENNPEFWQEIKELCVSIGTEFVHKSTGDDTIYTVESVEGPEVLITWDDSQNSIKYSIDEANAYFKKHTWIVIDKDYKILDTNYLGGITSVKRLSDSETFELGDFVIISSHRDKIVGIREVKDKILVHTERISAKLKSVEKVEVILTTEDGVDVYGEETLLYGVNKRSFDPGDMRAYAINKKESNFLWFSSKEARRQYIIHNKPCLSYNDVVSAAIGWPLLNKGISDITVSLVELRGLATKKICG